MAVVFHKYEDQVTDENLERLYQNVDLTRPTARLLDDKDASAIRLTTVSNQTMAESVDRLAQFIANNCRLREDIQNPALPAGQFFNREQLQQ